jgi:hypothetical protein
LVARYLRTCLGREQGGVSKGHGRSHVILVISFSAGVPSFKQNVMVPADNGTMLFFRLVVEGCVPTCFPCFSVVWNTSLFESKCVGQLPLSSLQLPIGHFAPTGEPAVVCCLVNVANIFSSSYNKRLVSAVYLYFSLSRHKRLNEHTTSSECLDVSHLPQDLILSSTRNVP